MAKGKDQKQKLTPFQRQARTYQIILAAVAIIVVVSMLLALLK